VGDLVPDKVRSGFRLEETDSGCAVVLVELIVEEQPRENIAVLGSCSHIGLVVPRIVCSFPCRVWRDTRTYMINAEVVHLFVAVVLMDYGVCR
jgi:hypothetical protein